MSLSLQPIGEAERAGLPDLFHLGSLSTEGIWAGGTVEGDGGWLAQASAGPVGAVLYQDEPVWLGGAVRPALRLTHFTVRPDCSQEPVFPTLMAGLRETVHHLGPAFIGKWGFRHADWATPFGMAPALLGWEWELGPPAVDPAWAAPGLRQAVPADLGAIAALYDRRAADLAGAVARPLPSWPQRLWHYLKELGGTRLLVCQEGHGLTGYLMLREVSTASGRLWQVDEWVDETPLAWRGLWHQLGELMAPGDRLLLPPHPADRPWLQVTAPWEVASRPIRGLHVRPGAMTPFLGAMRYQPGAGSLRLAVQDPLGLWPARIELAWADGRLTACEATSAEPDLALGVATLGQLALGLLRVAEARQLRRLAGPPEVCGRLDSIWQPQTLARFPLDRLLGRLAAGDRTVL